MTRSISRKLYRQFLLLYPEPFRKEFGDEMAGMFEECRRTQGPWHLLADVVLSAVRQQIHDFSIPAPKGASLYSEIVSSPNFARRLAAAAFAAALFTTTFAGERKAKTPESWEMIRPERRVWVARCVWKQYRPTLMRISKSGATGEKEIGVAGGTKINDLVQNGAMCVFAEPTHRSQ